MGLNKRRIMILLLVSICFFILLPILTVIKNNNIKIVNAQEGLINEFVSNDEINSPKELVFVIEEELNDEGESVITILNSQIVFYGNELDIVSAEEQIITLAKIDEVEKAIASFSIYLDFLSSDLNSTLCRSLV